MPDSLPLHEQHAQLGAALETQHDFVVPVRYSGVDAEVAALRGSAGVLDLSDRGWIAVTGDERSTFLQGQLSNDVLKTPAGHGCHATLLTRTGKLVSDLWLWTDDGAHWLDTEPDRADVTAQTLDRFVISEDVTLENRRGSVVHLGVAGPHATDVVARAFPDGPPSLGLLEHATAPSGARFAHRRAAGTELIEIWIAVADAVPAWKALLSSGATAAGREAWDLASLEAGEARWGLDVDENNLPLEANLNDAISYTKGCYIGQEVIAKATHLGRVNKRLVGLTHDGASPLAANDGVEAEGEAEPIGRVTRAAISPTLGRAIALAYVKWKFAEPGTPLVVSRAGGGSQPVRVVKLPFLDSLGGPQP